MRHTLLTICFTASCILVAYRLAHGYPADLTHNPLLERPAHPGRFRGDVARALTSPSDFQSDLVIV